MQNPVQEFTSIAKIEQESARYVQPQVSINVKPVVLREIFFLPPMHDTTDNQNLYSHSGEKAGT